jgi:Cu(I)/Ag(I) efflux system membrane fusion protein
MKRVLLSVTAAAAIAAVLVALGYWWGRSKSPHAPSSAATPTGAGSGAVESAGKRVLYYRNPMGLPDTSPTPKKDAMGMDYLPVYEGEEQKGSEIRIAPDKVQKLGVRTEAAALRALSRTVRAVGTIQVDERAMRTVAPRFEGWIQRLHVNATGQFVSRGQALMEVYSPELVAAQQEYLVATRGIAALKDAGGEIQASMRGLAEGSLQRLRNLDIAEEELARLRADGAPRDTLTLRSPAAGVVLEKSAVQGMRFMPGEMLYRIADLSSVWLLAEVFEQDLGGVRAGQAAAVQVSAYPGERFDGRIAFVYPTVSPETRTAKVRVELANRGLRLKPDMYASVELTTGERVPRLAVPDSAVLDSGTRRIVLVRRGEGLFEPREIKTGRRADGYVEVLDGLREGDQVVVSANFLIDAESNLKGALGAFGHSAHASAAGPGAAQGRTHSAAGTVESVNDKDRSVTIAHGPVASLKWPSMTMDFKVDDPAVRKGLRAGGKISFEFEESAPGEWRIVRSAPVTGVREAHKGH